MNQKEIYRLNDDISFRKCSLADDVSVTYGDCTNFSTVERNWKTQFCCEQEGIHFHCTKHPEIEFNSVCMERGRWRLTCPKCRNNIEIASLNELRNQCLRMLNINKFQDAKFVRLDDWYVQEIKEKTKAESGYWISTHVKTDKDGDTLVIVYVGHKDSNEKAQFFIKPEKAQLTSDHNDLDPAKIISKIEVLFKNRKLTQEFE